MKVNLDGGESLTVIISFAFLLLIGTLANLIKFFFVSLLDEGHLLVVLSLVKTV